MSKIKVLNLFAGIGGNVANLDREQYDITSVEFDRDIAEIYHRRFPNDNLVVGDAEDFLLHHYKDFDFIWASPPCQTHSRSRHAVVDKLNNVSAYYIDLSLYKIILFLKTFYRGKYCVENVIPYYESLIPPSYIVERHLLWTNFIVNHNICKNSNVAIEKSSINDLEKYHCVDDKLFDGLNLDFKKKRQILRNCCSLGFADIIDNCFKQENNKKYFQLSLDL